MPDVINHIENTETGKTELWITIKDASDLLGISERHTWRILLENSWKTKKLQNKDRKKTYILRQDVEKYYKEEQERQGLEQIKSLPPPLTPLTSMTSQTRQVYLTCLTAQRSRCRTSKTCLCYCQTIEIFSLTCKRNKND